MMYLGVGAVLYVLLAFVGSQSTAIFVVIACVIISYYGGGFATIPAYLKDEFGTLEVGAIHGRLLTAWAAAGVVGPLIVNGILDAAGEPGSLVADDYYPALITMTVLLVVGFVSNLMIRPVDSKHFDEEAVRKAEEWADEDRAVVTEEVAEMSAESTHRGETTDQPDAGGPGLADRRDPAGLRAVADAGQGRPAARRLNRRPSPARHGSSAYSAYANRDRDRTPLRQDAAGPGR